MENESLYEKVKKVNTYKPGDLTLKSLSELFQKWRTETPKKMTIHYPLFNYEGILNDEQFISFVEGAKKESKYMNIVFQGGSKGFDSFKERCDRLNIKFN